MPQFVIQIMWLASGKSGINYLLCHGWEQNPTSTSLLTLQISSLSNILREIMMAKTVLRIQIHVTQKHGPQGRQIPV